MFIKSLMLLLTICATVEVASATDKFKCPATEMTKFDETTGRILSLNEFQRKFPSEKAAIPTYCNETKHDVDLANSIIQKCMTGSAKQFSTIIAYSVRKTVILYCKSKKRHDQLIEMGKCVTKNEKNANKCLATYIDGLQRGKRAQPAKNRIGYACCNYYSFLNCLENVTKQNCSLKSSNSIQEFVRNVFQSIIDVACGDFTENSDRCDKLPTPPKKLKSDKKTKTFFLPLVDLWNNLADS